MSTSHRPARDPFGDRPADGFQKIEVTATSTGPTIDRPADGFQKTEWTAKNEDVAPMTPHVDKLGNFEIQDVHTPGPEEYIDTATTNFGDNDPNGYLTITMTNVDDGLDMLGG